MAARPGYSDVRGVWDHIAEFEEIKGTFVRDDGCLLAETDPRSDDLFSGVPRVVS
jgi:hypothetical protein